MVDKIKHYLEKFDFDVRKIKDARFMDQKVTPDVLCIIADCVINYLGNDTDKEFTVNDIWHSQYFIKNVKNIFNKPDASNPTARSEYDKFIQQPLKMLSYSHVLKCELRGNTNYFMVVNYELLEYIALRVRNSYIFLYEYLLKVLSDSGFLGHMESYKHLYLNKKLKQANFLELKEKFQQLMIGHTKIKGKTEVNRIFPKIINIYAAENIIPGTVKGKMSKGSFYYTDLMYNRVNWRDKNKVKELTRQEAENMYDAMARHNKAYDHYLIQKAMAIIRKKYQESEVRDQWAAGEATQVHHIFPKPDFPQLANYLENLIKLTATQHFAKAHPNNRTALINKDYQLVCLIAKSDSIERSLSAGESTYRKESFIYVIYTGLSLELNVNLSFSDIKLRLVHYYNHC